MKIFFTVNGWSPVGEFLPPSKLNPKPEPSLDNVTLISCPNTRLVAVSEIVLFNVLSINVQSINVSNRVITIKVATV